MEEGMELECVKEAIDVRESEDMPLKQLNDDDRPNRELVNGNDKLNEEHANDNGKANSEHVDDNDKPDTKHVDMNKHAPIGNEDEGTHEELEDLDIEMKEACDGEEVTEYDTDDSLIDDLQDEDPLSFQENNSDSSVEVSLTDAEIEELVMELLELESKAAEAQEALESESLEKVEDEVRVELAQTLQGDELENAVTEEMEAFVEQWKVALDDLETQSSLLLEQLDGAGVELPKLYRWIESQAPNVCGTEAWKKRAHWAGFEATLEVNAAVANAEKYLQCCRPVKMKHGKLLEEGAGGFLAKKLAGSENGGTCHEHSFKDWASFNEYLQSSKNSITNGFGSKNWASVYLASTPQQAAEMGLTFPGVDEVEEIDEIQIDADHPFYADAIANEKDIDLSEEQRNKFKKIREEEDAKFTKKLQNHLKRRRWKKLQNQNPCNDFDSNCPTISVGKEDSEDGDLCHASIIEKKLKLSALIGIELNENSVDNGVVHSDTEARLQSCSEEMNIAQKRNAVIVDSDDEAQPLTESTGNISSQQIIHEQTLNQAKEICDVTDVDSFCETPKNFHCTACFTLLKASMVQKHPLLEVIVCESCKFMIKEKMENVVTDNDESYCKWCGRCKDLVNCVSCKSLFCRTCIKRNLGDGQLLEMKASTWQCCCCSPDVLKKLIMDWNIAYNGVVLSSSGSDSELVGSDFDISPRKKKRRKKRIRRIIDDAELGEETRQKIEIEKARQEHLNSMKFSGQWSKNEVSSMTMEESANPDILGDASNGYIVNVAREEDEEPVRIPPSISSKLKPHQVSGIRFMWENIIQSVGKIRSGDKGLGCILAHTMGLGKTFQVIAFLYSALRSIDLGLKTVLIVTPVNVLHNWRQEFFKWRPVDVKALRVFMVEDVPRDKRAHLLSKWRSKGGVLLIGYASFRNLSFGKHLKDRNIAAEICDSLQNGPDILICDEAHIIKNARADTTQALKRVKTQRRIALTGSPLQNNLMEYYCMVDFVREGFLGSSHEFRNRFQNPIENGQHTNSTRDDVKIMNQRSHILYKQLKGFVQRVDMNVMKKDLPPKTVYVISVKLSPLQKKLYKKFLDVHGFTDKVSCSDKAAAKRCFFAGYQALAQIWNHPGLLQMTKGHRDNLIREDVVDNFLGDTSSDDNKEHTCLPAESHLVKNAFFANKKSDEIIFHEEADWWRELLDEKIYNQVDFSGKMVLLIDILSMSSEIGDKALVFSQSLSTLDLIELFLSKLKRKEKDHKYWKQGKDWYRLDGSTKGSERQKLVERFNDPNNKRVKCTLISTRAGSLGINLYAANRVIIVDGSWNPTHDLQAIYRVWRYGQMKPVFAYRLMAHGTMEEKIYKRQVTKEGLAARVMDRQQIHRTMSKEEMLHLFDFGDDENVETFVDENQEEKPRVNMEKTSGLTDLLKQKSLSLSDGVGLSDKIMEGLLNRYYPRWIKDCHEHETLLQENEDEKLSKEEQDMAWETFWRSIEWEEAQKVVPSDNPSFEQKPPRHPTSISESIQVQQNKNNVRGQSAHSVRSQTEHSVKSQPTPTRKCSNLSHLLTLRSRGTKSGSSTTCGECSQDISWENLSRDGKPR